ncbi:cell division protein FtsL [Nevskia sp.]|uniref:cell division protein FtsL n=1 Tax=Nevskia sp. TaxID=1929292 RepID=UPI0025F589E4|nr:cell division protein FtsL [Nevskia sp.]
MAARPTTSRRDTRASGSLLLPIGLALLVVFSALGVVQIKNEHRRMTVKAEALRVDNERLDLEWAQLQLEEATLAQAARVEPIARAQFGLVEPAAWQTIEAVQGPVSVTEPTP